MKYRNLAGQQCDFVPGWDCHGLPIEQAVGEAAAGEEDRQAHALARRVPRAVPRVRAGVRRRAAHRVQALGVLGRWDEPYKTLTFDYEAQEIRELAKFAAQGALYRKKKPVYWCVTDQTALAEAEVEYEDHPSPSVYVAFGAEGRPGREVERAEGQAGRLRHLDHHAVDAAGQPGHLRAPQARVRLLRAGRAGGRAWRRTCWRASSPRWRRSELKSKDVTGGGRRSFDTASLVRPDAAFSPTRTGERAVGADVPARASTRGCRPVHPRRARHARAGHRAGAHRARPRPGGLRGGPRSTGSTSTTR